MPLPRILIIDDLFGRQVADKHNEDRANLCGQYLLEDVTGDEVGLGALQRIKAPVAQAVFHRGQTPTLARVGDTVTNDIDGTLTRIRDGWAHTKLDQPCWSLVLLDLCFHTGPVTPESDLNVSGMPVGCPGDDRPEQYFGLQLLEALHHEFPALPVVILSSKSRSEVSERFSALGALGFLERDSDGSPELLRDYLFRHGLVPDESGTIVGQSSGLLIALREARRAALHRVNIILHGPRGTGKELFAAYVHRHSDALELRPFIVVNSGTLTPELYRSELFGHRRGAFTSADRNHIGAIEQAHGGDLFLDEIGNMPLDVQAGLLRVLEDRRVAPIGDTEAREVNVRFISATNADMQARIAAGSFLPDLLDRLGYARAIVLPPLCDRKEDIPLLVERFLRDAEASFPGAMRRHVTTEAHAKLIGYSWPGNVRELRECIFKAVARHPDLEYLVGAHLDFTLLTSPAASQRQPVTIGHEVAQSIEQVTELMCSFDFDSIKSYQLNGRLRELQAAYARFTAAYLKAALKATAKPTPANPYGEVFIHPAMKLMTGDSSLSASRACDIIKRLLKIDPLLLKEVLSDPLLSQAWEKANRLRPPAGSRK